LVLLVLSCHLISDVCKDQFWNFTQVRAHTDLIEYYMVGLQSVLLIIPTAMYHGHIHPLHRCCQLLLLSMSDGNLKKMSLYSECLYVAFATLWCWVPSGGPLIRFNVSVLVDITSRQIWNSDCMVGPRRITKCGSGRNECLKLHN
jgi:hypothetical protein